MAGNNINHLHKRTSRSWKGGKQATTKRVYTRKVLVVEIDFARTMKETAQIDYMYVVAT